MEPLTHTCLRSEGLTRVFAAWSARNAGLIEGKGFSG
jgi:hypothetical protein